MHKTSAAITGPDPTHKLRIVRGSGALLRNLR